MEKKIVNKKVEPARKGFVRKIGRQRVIGCNTFLGLTRPWSLDVHTDSAKVFCGLWLRNIAVDDDATGAYLMINAQLTLNVA